MTRLLMLLIAILLSGCSSMPSLLAPHDDANTVMVQITRDPTDKCAFTMMRPGYPRTVHARVIECSKSASR